MKKVYILEHHYLLEDSEYEDNYEIKSLGIYSSKELAQEAICRYAKLPGFSKYQPECFKIFESELDKDAAWTDGFANSIDINKDFEILTQCFIDWMGLDCDISDSLNDKEFYSALCDVFKVVYSTKNVDELSNMITNRFNVIMGEKQRNSCSDLANRVFPVS